MPSIHWLRHPDLDDWESRRPPPRNEALRELVDGLPEREQEVVSMYFFGQMTLKAIAAELDLHVTTVTRVRNAGLERLKRALDEDV